MCRTAIRPTTTFATVDMESPLLRRVCHTGAPRGRCPPRPSYPRRTGNLSSPCQPTPAPRRRENRLAGSSGLEALFRIGQAEVGADLGAVYEVLVDARQALADLRGSER